MSWFNPACNWYHAAARSQPPRSPHQKHGGKRGKKERGKGGEKKKGEREEKKPHGLR